LDRFLYWENIVTGSNWALDVYKSLNVRDEAFFMWQQIQSQANQEMNQNATTAS
jgi:hypothetical protein